MTNLGGYLAVTYVAEQVFIDALDAVWRVNWDVPNGAFQWGADTPFGRLEASGAISANKPGIAFHGATNSVAVDLSAASRFDVALGGAVAGGVYIDMSAALSATVLLSQQPGFHKAVVDLSSFTLDAAHLRLTWFDGPHDPHGDDAILSPEARAELAAELRKRFATFLTFRLPTDELWLRETALMTQGIPGSIIFTPMITLGAARVLDGWLALGIDATSGIGESHGDAAQIGPPPDAPPLVAAPMPQADPGNGSLRVILDPPLVIKYLTANARFALKMAEATRPTIHPSDDVAVTLEDETIVVHAHGTVNAPDPFPGQMPFTADIRVRPFIPKNTHTVYASIKPNIEVDADWFLDVLGGMIDFFGGDAYAKLNRANKSEMAVLFGAKVEQKVPDMFALWASIKGCQLAIRPDLIGIFGEASVSTTFSEPSLDPTPNVVSGVPIRDRFLQLQFSSLGGNRRLIVDPTFRVRYSIKRGSSGVEVASGVEWSGMEQPFGAKVDLWDDANVMESSFSVELSVERPPGVEVARQSQSIAVIDLFDRTHPFVRWRKQHYFTGSATPATRLSAVHRTAIRERCRFCDTGTQRARDTYLLEALDAIPAPDEAGFSTRLCKYCFPNG